MPWKWNRSAGAPALPNGGNRAPYAVFECFQSIPCNPATPPANLGAVKPLTDINDLPEVYYDKCTGCGLCDDHLRPGLAVLSSDEDLFGGQDGGPHSYEFLPCPRWDTVDAGWTEDGQWWKSPGGQGAEIPQQDLHRLLGGWTTAWH